MYIIFENYEYKIIIFYLYCYLILVKFVIQFRMESLKPTTESNEKFKVIVNKSTILWLIILPNLCAISFILLYFGFNQPQSVCSCEFNHLTKGSDQFSSSSKTTTIVVPSLRIVTRDEWTAQPPSSSLTDLQLPISRVIIAHTATEGCQTQEECMFRVRYIQTFHMNSRNWDDIGYNFLVGGDGNVYEGRGWLKQGAHTKSKTFSKYMLTIILSIREIKFIFRF